MYKNLTKRAALPMLALGLLLSCTPDEEQATPSTAFNADATDNAANGAASQAVKIKKGHYMLIASGSELPADLSSQVKGMKGNVTGIMQNVGIATVTSDDPAFADKASKIKGVTVVPDLEIQWYNPDDMKVMAFDAEAFGDPPFSGDNDPYFELQWGHDAVDAPQAWNAGHRGKGVRVAVLDGGFDLDHPDLAPNIDLAASRSFVVGEELQYMLNNTFSHGTHTAGTVAAADNGFGVIGVAPEAELILVKVLRDSGSGSFSWMMQGILHAVEMGADVVNMSLGASLPVNGKFLDEDGNVINDTKAVQELLNAISKVTNYATQRGVTLIASAGNDANNGQKDKSLIHIPSGSANVISISATAPVGWALNPLTANLDGLASYSNYGVTDVDFAAPGGDAEYPGNEIVIIGPVRQYAYVFDLVFSTGNNGWYWSAGTSMASPHAAGVAAIIIGANGGDMDPAHVRAALRASADDIGKPGRDPYFGHGRVNAFKAVSALQ